MSSRHQVRFYRQGLEEVGRGLRGDERIYSGLRPSDYHAGNSIVLAVYPQLLARTVAAGGRPVRFEYVITLNDMEPAVYDLRTFRPQAPSIAFTADIEGVVARVEEDLRHLLGEFPEISVRFIRTSSMVGTDVFRRAVEVLTREKRDYLSHFLPEQYVAGLDVDDIEFMGRVCGECRTPVKMSAGEVTAGACPACGSPLTANGPHYWMYYVPLLAMKLRILQPDVVLLGSDYVEPYGQGLTGMKHLNPLESILDFYDLLQGGRPLEFLLPPVLVGEDGQKMSKSLGNIRDIPYEQVLAACARAQDRDIFL